jgi:hypothetical protein
MAGKKTTRFNRHSAEKKLEQAWRDVLNENGLIPSPAEVRKKLKEAYLSKKTPIMGGVTIGMSLALGGIGKAFAKGVKTEEQLQKALADIREAREKMPTAIRKATKELVHALPRRGGPGRQPKLNALEAVQVCDQIGVFIRQKNTLKKSLAKTSELTPTLLGKKVSARTLQKAWDKRDQFTGNTK